MDFKVLQIDIARQAHRDRTITGIFWVSGVMERTVRKDRVFYTIGNGYRKNCVNLMASAVVNPGFQSFFFRVNRIRSNAFFLNRFGNNGFGI